MSKDKQQFGQYMTPEIITNFMVSLISHDNSAKVLEPSCGDGAFLYSLSNHGYNNLDAFEIDKSIIPDSFLVKNCSFVSADLKDKYDVIIGNPPYIRWKNLEEELKIELEDNKLWNEYCNSLCDYSAVFIIKAIELLNDGGELIFITPEYWLSTTHSAKMRDFIINNGYISHIYHFNETPIFGGVNVSLIIFRFVKDTSVKPDIAITKYNSRHKITDKVLGLIKTGNGADVEAFSVPHFKNGERWILADNEIVNMVSKLERSCTLSGRNYECCGDYFDIGNGMVSGLDKAFQIPKDLPLVQAEVANTIGVVKAKDLKSFSFKNVTRYIFVADEISEDEFTESFPNFNQLLIAYKDQLLSRYNYGRNIKYWEWVFLRNYSLFSKKVDRIFVPCKERITNKDRMRFSFIPAEYYPTQDVTAIFKKDCVKESLFYIVAYLNSKYVFNWLVTKGIRKGDIVEFSEKPISMIPYRTINFNDNAEVEIYNSIVTLSKEYIESSEEKLLCLIDKEFDSLIGG